MTLFPTKAKAGLAVMAKRGQVAVTAFSLRNRNCIWSDTDLWVLRASQQRGWGAGAARLRETPGTAASAWQDRQLQLQWVSATGGDVAWDVFPIWDRRPVPLSWFQAAEESVQVSNSSDGHRHWNTLQASCLVCMNGICTLRLSRAWYFLAPSTADFLIFKGKPYNHRSAPPVP